MFRVPGPRARSSFYAVSHAGGGPRDRLARQAGIVRAGTTWETRMMVPFENVKYVQVYPAPADVSGHTCIKGASVAG